MGLWQGAAGGTGVIGAVAALGATAGGGEPGDHHHLADGRVQYWRAGSDIVGWAWAAVAVALLLPESPPLIVIPLAIVCGIIGGALWSAIAGALKVWFNSDEVINTLMLNFIAVLLIQWVTTGPFKDDSTRGENASTPRIDLQFRLSDGTGGVG